MYQSVENDGTYSMFNPRPGQYHVYGHGVVRPKGYVGRYGLFDAVAAAQVAQTQWEIKYPEDEEDRVLHDIPLKDLKLVQEYVKGIKKDKRFDREFKNKIGFGIFVQDEIEKISGHKARARLIKEFKNFQDFNIMQQKRTTNKIIYETDKYQMDVESEQSEASELDIGQVYKNKGNGFKLPRFSNERRASSYFGDQHGRVKNGKVTEIYLPYPANINEWNKELKIACASSRIRNKLLSDIENCAYECDLGHLDLKEQHLVEIIDEPDTFITMASGKIKKFNHGTSQKILLHYNMNVVNQSSPHHESIVRFEARFKNGIIHEVYMRIVYVKRGYKE